MSLKNKLFGFLLVGVLSLSFIPPVASATQHDQITITLENGWNSISVPLFARLNAKKVCETHPNIDQVARWDNEFDYYMCNEDNQNNFTIAPYQGFLVNNTSQSLEWSIKGKSVDPEYDWGSGWNYVGLESNTYSDAQSVCQLVNGVTRVTRYSGGVWGTHNCAIPFLNNFDILDNVGYLLLVE